MNLPLPSWSRCLLPSLTPLLRDQFFQAVLPLSPTRVGVLVGSLLTSCLPLHSSAYVPLHVPVHSKPLLPLQKWEGWASWVQESGLCCVSSVPQGLAQRPAQQRYCVYDWIIGQRNTTYNAHTMFLTSASSFKHHDRHHDGESYMGKTPW